MAGSCGQTNEVSGSMKGGKCIKSEFYDTVVRQKNLVVRPALPGTKNDFPVEGQQWLSGRYLLNKDMLQQITQ
jgi:hypothetical protein